MDASQVAVGPVQERPRHGLVEVPCRQDQPGIVRTGEKTREEEKIKKKTVMVLLSRLWLLLLWTTKVSSIF